MVFFITGKKFSSERPIIKFYISLLRNVQLPCQRSNVIRWTHQGLRIKAFTFLYQMSSLNIHHALFGKAPTRCVKNSLAPKWCLQDGGWKVSLTKTYPAYMHYMSNPAIVRTNKWFPKIRLPKRQRSAKGDSALNSHFKLLISFYC